MNAHDKMLRAYSVGGASCGGCAHCVGGGGAAVLTCEIARKEAQTGHIDHVRVLRWDLRWKACGLWTVRA